MRVVELFLFIVVLLNVSCNSFRSKSDYNLANLKANDLVEEAEKGDDLAQFKLGYCYSAGYGGVTNDSHIAYVWYTRSAEQGNIYAKYFMAQSIYSGIGGLVANPSKGESLFQEILPEIQSEAENGVPMAQCCLAGYYLRGICLPQDYDEAIRWARLSDLQGNIEATVLLGCCYMGKEDYFVAKRYWERAAEQGHQVAKNTLDMAKRESIIFCM